MEASAAKQDLDIPAYQYAQRFSTNQESWLWPCLFLFLGLSFLSEQVGMH